MSEQQMALLQTYYSRAFPQQENAQVSNLVSLSAGWESDVYGFVVEWGPPDLRQREGLVLRIYPGVDAQEKSSAEYRSLAMLYQAGYPVPRVDCLERERSPFGQPFLIMQRIPGSTLWAPLFHSAPDEQQKRLELFCSLFARLHAIDWRPWVPNAVEYEPAGLYAIVERLLARWRPFVESMPLPGFQTGWQWLVDHSHDVTSQRASLVHWDFHPANILLTEKQEAFVIDWTGLDITDYRSDLAWTLVLVDSYEGETWRDRILREYERQAGHPVEGLAYFEGLACFRRLFSVMASLALGAEKMGMRPGAEETMRKQVVQLRRVYARYQAITGLVIPEVENFFHEAGV